MSEIKKQHYIDEEGNQCSVMEFPIMHITHELNAPRQGGRGAYTLNNQRQYFEITKMFCPQIIKSADEKNAEQQIINKLEETLIRLKMREI